jgi:hypothetical protein
LRGFAPSRPDQGQELGKMGVGIVGRGTLPVVLHCENWKCFVPKAFHRSVVQVHVGDLEIGRAGIPSGVPFTEKP